MNSQVEAKLMKYHPYALRGDVSKIANIDSLTEDRGALPDVFGRDTSDVGVDEIAAESLMFAGKRRDGYLFFGWKRNVADEVRVLAGCQNITLTEARAYWGERHGRHAEVRPLLDAIEAWASSGAVSVQRTKTADRVDTALVREFMGERLFSMFSRWNAYGRAKPSLIQGENMQRAE